MKPSITFRVDGAIVSCAGKSAEARIAAEGTQAFFEAIIKAGRDRAINIEETDFEVTIRAGLPRLIGPRVSIITDEEAE